MGSLLLELRQAKGKTQAEVAAEVSTDRSTYAHIELGRTRPSLVLAYNLARYFGVSIEELFGSMLEPNSTPEVTE